MEFKESMFADSNSKLGRTVPVDRINIDPTAQRDELMPEEWKQDPFVAKLTNAKPVDKPLKSSHPNMLQNQGLVRFPE